MSKYTLSAMQRNLQKLVCANKYSNGSFSNTNSNMLCRLHTTATIILLGCVHTHTYTYLHVRVYFSLIFDHMCLQSSEEHDVCASIKIHGQLPSIWSGILKIRGEKKNLTNRCNKPNDATSIYSLFFVWE